MKRLRWESVALISTLAVAVLAGVWARASDWRPSGPQYLHFQVETEQFRLPLDEGWAVILASPYVGTVLADSRDRRLTVWIGRGDVVAASTRIVGDIAAVGEVESIAEEPVPSGVLVRAAFWAMAESRVAWSWTVTRGGRVVQVSVVTTEAQATSGRAALDAFMQLNQLIGS